MVIKKIKHFNRNLKLSSTEDVYLDPQAITTIETGEKISPFKSFQSALNFNSDELNILVSGDPFQDLVLNESIFISKNVSIR